MAINKGDKVELTIEKLVFEGAGLARLDDVVVFVEDTAPNEKISAEIISINKNFARAKVVEILEPSQARVKPFCALANVCGGCSWQHISYDEQLKQKKQIVEETVRKISGEDIKILDVIPSPQTKEFRHKIQYPTAQTRVSKRILAGYYKKNTHELVNIKHCPIQPAIIDEIAEFIRDEAPVCRVTAYDEKRHKGTLRHLVFRHSAKTNECLVIFVVNDFKQHDNLKMLANKVFNKFKCVIGCLVNYNENRTNTIFGKLTEPIVGQDFYIENLGDKTYQISAASFFQVNPKAAENILKTVKSMIVKEVKEPRILDVYSGVGSFGVFLGDIAKSVTCVEDFEPAANDAVENVKLNKLKNFDILTGDAKLQLQKLLDDKKSFDAVIVDPPRKGLAPEAVEAASKLSKNLIIYVSCNPSTLARDIKLFKEYGFKTEYIQPVDMFCHTYHIENVALLKKV